MHVKFINDEDFLQYRTGCLFIGAPTCTWKCCDDCGAPHSMCQNYSWSKEKVKEISNEDIYKRFNTNKLTDGIVFGGLEPMDNFFEIIAFISYVRKTAKDNCPIIIYTGYYEDEITDKINVLKSLTTNIIMKFGRYKPGFEPHYDEVLGVELASPNQYGAKIC